MNMFNYRERGDSKKIKKSKVLHRLKTFMHIKNKKNEEKNYSQLEERNRKEDRKMIITLSSLVLFAGVIVIGGAYGYNNMNARTERILNEIRNIRRLDSLDQIDIEKIKIIDTYYGKEMLKEIDNTRELDNRINNRFQRAEFDALIEPKMNIK